MATLKVNNETIEIAPENLPAATPLAKGAVKQGDGAPIRQEWGNADVKQANDIVRSLRESGAIINNKFSLIYDPNDGGENSASHPVRDDNTYTSGQSATIKFEAEKAVPAREGYDFIGWATSPSAVTPDYPLSGYEGGNSYTVTFSNNDIILYAIWQAKTYTVRYNFGDYGTGSKPQDQTVAEGESVNLLFSPVPSVNDNSGRVFVGWKEVSDYEGTDYDSYEQADYTGGNTIKGLYADVDLYPVFCAVRTLEYANYNSTGTLPTSQTAYNGQILQIDFNPSITSTDQSKPNFAGWSETQGASNADYTATGTTEISMSRNVTLYPVFEAQGASNTITIDAVSSTVDILVTYEQDMMQHVTRIPAGTTALYTFTVGVSHFIRFDTGASTMAAQFEGSYYGVGYPQGTSLSVADGYIRNPGGMTNDWSGSANISGTLTCLTYDM